MVVGARPNRSQVTLPASSLLQEDDVLHLLNVEFSDKQVSYSVCLSKTTPQHHIDWVPGIIYGALLALWLSSLAPKAELILTSDIYQRAFDCLSIQSVLQNVLSCLYSHSASRLTCIAIQIWCCVWFSFAFCPQYSLRKCARHWKAARIWSRSHSATQLWAMSIWSMFCQAWRVLLLQ